MEPNDATIQTLRAQESALCDVIAELEEAMLASSTPGIREYRRKRLGQLADKRAALGDRLGRLDLAPSPAVEAHMIGEALKETTLVARGTFGR